MRIPPYFATDSDPKAHKSQVRDWVVNAVTRALLKAQIPFTRTGVANVVSIQTTYGAMLFSLKYTYGEGKLKNYKLRHPVLNEWVEMERSEFIYWVKPLLVPKPAPMPKQDASGLVFHAPDELKAALRDGILNAWEHTFYLNVRTQAKISDKQLVIKTRLDEKIAGVPAE